MPDVNKQCDTCGHKTIHIVSGSGHKSVCSICETKTEYGYEEGVVEDERSV